MKAERISRSTVISGVSYFRRADAGAVAEPGPPPDNATVLGIPESEFTPSVRDAIMKLMGEVRELRQELERTQARLEDAERAADQDHLVSILNRRAFVRELTRQISFSARYGAPSSLVYFDLDGFKHVNDTYGHAAGDTVLKHFSETLTAHVRESDVVGRLGGDEFGVILAQANQEQANRKARSLIDTLGAHPATFEGRPLHVGVSYGAFELRASDDADGAMARADQAMYSRKRAAR